MNKILIAIAEMGRWLSEREIVQTGEAIDMLKEIGRMVQEADYSSRENVKENVYKLREEYFIISGKKPYLGWPESVLESKVAELKDKNLVKWKSLDTKKSWWQK